jgi:E3 ubiquitin-protein ligase RNF1/2
MNTKANAEKPAAKVDRELEMNPISKYQEATCIPYLTLFDINRKPRKLSETKSSDTVCRNIDPLKQLFTCPICLGYIKKTYIVMECLHRFCSDCVQKCLRVGKKEW